MFKRIAPALLLAIMFTTAASAEQFTGRMMVNSKDAGTLVLKTDNGLLALGHTPDMTIAGVPNLEALKVCDELSIDTVRSGPALAIRSISVKSAGKAED